MLQPLPFTTRLIGLTQMMEQIWVRWFQTLVDLVTGAPIKVGGVDLTAQAASVPTTALPTTAPLPAGVYRLTSAARITQAATISSTLTLTMGWTDGGVSCAKTFATVSGNTISTTDSQTYSVHVDAGTPLTYSVAWSSAGATAMRYALSLLVEALP